MAYIGPVFNTIGSFGTLASHLLRCLMRPVWVETYQNFNYKEAIMSNTSIVECCDCEKPIIVINNAIGDNCVINLCTKCADAPISVHNPDNPFASCPRESMVVGALVEESITTTRCKTCGTPVSKLHAHCLDCAPNF